jgi:CheY-like chemotaxis protein
VTHSTTALILIVEDEPVIAMMLEAHLYDMGLRTVLARSNAEASQMIEREHVDAALLDFHVLDGTSEVLAAHLHALGIPFAMCTGSTATDLGKICPGVPVLQKPYSDEALSAAINTLLNPRDPRHAAS